uniref:Mannosyl-oligosaccharide glucosidase n=1 Tax=Romanomermis culicivorax TaxID=13658 RepID=A0A915KUU7_ROMCU
MYMCQKIFRFNMATDREKSISKTPPPQKYVSMSNNNNHKSPKPPTLKNKKNNKGQSKLMVKIGKVFALLILPITFGVALYHIHMNYFYLPSIVNTPSKLPKILNDNYFSNVSSETGDYFWGTYRSLCYLGIRARASTSPVFGLIWYTQPSMNVIMPSVRHWCSQSDKMKRYGWIEHDGKTFGVQEIVDDDLLIKTSFVKRPGCCHGGDWSFRVEAETTNPLENDTTYAFIVYVAMDPASDQGFLKPSIKNGKYITKVDGQHPDLGSFSLNFGKASNTVMRNFMAADAVDFALLKEATITGTGFGQYNGGNDASTASFYMQLMGYVPRDHPPTQNPRFLANQYTVIGSTKFDIVYESGSLKRLNKLTGNIFDQELQKRIEEFNQKFEDTFHLKEKMQADVYIEVGKHALSNMLGSMGYFHGSAKVASQYTPQPVPYGPLTLFSTVPSRSFFPRGFLWDEGFHQLLIFQWNSNLTREIIGSWLDLMNVEGWIPREVILGSESEARVPAEFVVQQDKVANPPMFFYIIRMMLNRMNDKSFDKEEIEATQNGLRKFYPRLKAWYSWLNSSQSGHIPGTYRWRGRNGTTDRELNPKTLPSGLDDYPRASHPDEREYHIDLYSWMAFSSKVMVDLAKLFQDKESLPAYETTQFIMGNGPLTFQDLEAEGLFKIISTVEKKKERKKCINKQWLNCKNKENTSLASLNIIMFEKAEKHLNKAYMSLNKAYIIYKRKNDLGRIGKQILVPIRV